MDKTIAQKKEDSHVKVLGSFENTKEEEIMQKRRL